MIYDIFTARSAAQLGALVQAAIREGWRPIGGVSVALNGSPEHGDLVYAQAMILEVTNEE